MAFSAVSIMLWLFTIALINLSLYACFLGAAGVYLPEEGVAGAIDEDPSHKGGDEDYMPHEGAAGADHDPSQVVPKDLLCFNDHYIYSSCEVSYRLTESGDLHVPPQETDLYCTGPCLSETKLVLDCLENAVSHFLFDNKATISDIRETIKAGCSYGSERGDFSVAEHIKVDKSSALKASKSLIFGVVSMIIGCSLLF